jgi:hypothetical protein
MSVLRTHHGFAPLLAAVLALGPAASPARADSPYSLHVKVSKGDWGRALDLSVPWDLERGSSPFDFTREDGDGPDMARLREAWAALSRLPERKSVLIQGEHRQVRAWREAGALVLQPLDEESDRGTLVRIPTEIVEAILHRDGRLTSRDLVTLLRDRREISLVSVRSNRGAVQVWIDRGGDAGE